MFNKLAVILAGLVVGVSLQLHGAIPKKVVIIGEVASVAEQTITVKTDTGNVKLPRKSISDHKTVRVGESVRAEVPMTTLAKLNQ